MITSSEYELSDYTDTEILIDKLFEILNNYSFDVKKVFSVKHGEDQNTIMHLAVDTANVAIVKRLVACYPKKDGNNNLFDQMILCNVRNQKGQTPLSSLATAMSHHRSICSKHKYDRGCEACDHEIDMRVRWEDTLLYLLELGAALFESTPSNKTSFIEFLLHYYIKHDSGDFFIQIMQVISERKINKYKQEELICLRDKNNNTLLFYAVLYRDYKFAEHLLSLGACPMWFNDEEVSPIFCAIAFRDIEMVKYLSKARCILDRTCNINKKNRNGLTAQDIAQCPNGAGISSSLERYQNDLKARYSRQIVHNEWNWEPNPQIEQLIELLSNHYKAKTIRKRDLHFHSKLDRNGHALKRNHADFTNEPDDPSGYINQNKRNATPLAIMMLSRDSMTMVTPSPFGGG